MTRLFGGALALLFFVSCTSGNQRPSPNSKITVPTRLAKNLAKKGLRLSVEFTAAPSSGNDTTSRIGAKIELYTVLQTKRALKKMGIDVISDSPTGLVMNINNYNLFKDGSRCEILIEVEAIFSKFMSKHTARFKRQESWPFCIEGKGMQTHRRSVMRDLVSDIFIWMDKKSTEHQLSAGF